MGDELDFEMEVERDEGGAKDGNGSDDSAGPSEDDGNGMTLVTDGVETSETSILGSLGVASALGGLEPAGATVGSAFSGTAPSASSSSSGAIWKRVRFSN